MPERKAVVKVRAKEINVKMIERASPASFPITQEGVREGPSVLSAIPLRRLAAGRRTAQVPLFSSVTCLILSEWMEPVRPEEWTEVILLAVLRQSWSKKRANRLTKC